MELANNIPSTSVHVRPPPIQPRVDGRPPPPTSRLNLSAKRSRCVCLVLVPHILSHRCSSGTGSDEIYTASEILDSYLNFNDLQTNGIRLKISFAKQNLPTLPQEPTTLHSVPVFLFFTHPQHPSRPIFVDEPSK